MIISAEYAIKACLFWKSRCKRYSKKTDDNDIHFGNSAVGITRFGSYHIKVFKKECKDCSIVYGYKFHVRDSIVQFTSRLRDCD